MSLIFAATKTHFLMLCFGTFSLTLEYTDFHFPFEILAWMMQISALFAGIAWQDIWPRKPWLHLKKSYDDLFENFVINDIVWLFFKTEFWRRVEVYHHDDETLWIITV